MAHMGDVFEGKTLDAAVKRGLESLGLSRAEVMITILEEGSGGFLGLGARPYRVRVMRRPGGPPPADQDRDERRRRGSGRDRRERDRDRGGRDGRQREAGRGSGDRRDQPRERGEGRRGDDRRGTPLAAGGGSGRGAEAARREERRGERREERLQDPRGSGASEPAGTGGGRRGERRPERPFGRGERREERRDSGEAAARAAAFEERDDEQRRDEPVRAFEPQSPGFENAQPRGEEGGEGRRRRRGRRGGRRRHGASGGAGVGAAGAPGGVPVAAAGVPAREDSGAPEGRVSMPPAAEERVGGSADLPVPFATAEHPRADDQREPRPGASEGPGLTGEELAAQGVRVTEQLLAAMGFEAKVGARVDGNHVDVTAEVARDEELLTGRKGEVRQALQHLLNRRLNRGETSRYHLQLEINDFWKRREEELRDLARSLAEEAVASGGEAVTEYLNAQERRIVHVTLRDDTRVKTYALGTGMIKRVAIAPADFEGGPRDEGD